MHFVVKKAGLLLACSLGFAGCESCAAKVQGKKTHGKSVKVGSKIPVMPVAISPGAQPTQPTVQLPKTRENKEDGNTPPASGSLIATSAPNPVTVSGFALTNDPKPTWTWSSGGGGAGEFRYKLNNSDFGSGAVRTTALEFTPSILFDGVHTLYVQERDEYGNWSSSGSFSVKIDTTQPVALQGFSGNTSSEGAAIDLVIDLPVDTSDYDHISIRRISGVLPPDCDDGEEALFISDFVDNPINFKDVTPIAGHVFSYRACIYDQVGNVSSSDKLFNIAANFFEHTIFVTSSAHTGNLGGLAGADRICQELALDQNLTGIWKAVLSDDDNDAKNRLLFLGNVYDRNDNFVNEPDKLWTANVDTLSSIITIDEKKGDAAGVNSWTGTMHNGVRKTGSNCENWTVASGFNGRIGSTDREDARWLDNGDQGCSNQNRLYCINQSFPKPLADFIVNTGSSSGEIDLVIQFPNDLTDYAYVDVRRKVGATAPAVTCADEADTIVLSGLIDFTSDWIATDDADSGSNFSYRVCVFDSNGFVIATNIVEDIQSLP